MEREKVEGLAKEVLDAWNSQDVDRVLACYTEDCVYQDPTTQGPVRGHEDMRRYLTKLFAQWKMYWTLREFYLFSEGTGGGFLWQAELTPASGGKTVSVNGMDLVIVDGDRLCRNEVYFDTGALFRDQ